MSTREEQEINALSERERHEMATFALRGYSFHRVQDNGRWWWATHTHHRNAWSASGLDALLAKMSDFHDRVKS